MMKLEDGTVVDSSGETNIDNNFFFALGSEPEPPFPEGWDYGLYGMTPGERRVLTNPPCMGYGAKGLAEYKIPPYAKIIYDVELISINGES